MTVVVPLLLVVAAAAVVLVRERGHRERAIGTAEQRGGRSGSLRRRHPSIVLRSSVVVVNKSQPLCFSFFFSVARALAFTLGADGVDSSGGLANQ